MNTLAPSEAAQSAAIQRFFLMASVLTCSFEIFLVLNLGFNFKACQVATALTSILFFISWSRGQLRLCLPDYLSLLLAAFFLSVVFAPNSQLPERGLGYSLWFAFDIVGVVLFFNLFNSVPRLVSLLKFTLISFCLVSLFGVSQLILGVLGFNPPLVTQWWFEGVLPRINGFNYEPSFFATYLILGWVLVTYFYEKRVPLISRRLVIVTSCLTSLTLILCSSRMGWLAMALWMTRPFWFMSVRLLQTGLISVKNARYLLASTAALVIAIVLVVNFVPVTELSFLVKGLGLLEGGGNESSGERSQTATSTALVAADHLIIGVGLGGVPGEIAKLYGVNIAQLEDAKLFEGKNITFEIAASLGLAGLALIYGYFALIFRRALRLSKAIKSSTRIDQSGSQLLSITLRALTWAILMELLLLQLNQNFLRAYTWTFVGLLAATIGVAKQHTRNQPSKEDSSTFEHAVL